MGWSATDPSSGVVRYSLAMGEPVVAVDTSAEAQRVLDTRWRAMSPTEKFRVAEQLTSMATTLACTGIRRRYPDISKNEMRFQLVSRRYGEVLADEVRAADNAV